MGKDIIYEEIKEMIGQFNLTPEEYEEAIKKLADILEI